MSLPLSRRLTRRRFLACCAAAVGAAEIRLRARQRDRLPRREPRDTPRLRLERIASQLRSRYRDLPSHVVFEYYPWYGTEPWRHWDEAGRTPPADIASNYLPALGPYDSRSARVIEQHARWIRDAGIAAVNLSWWGPGTYEDAAVPLVMDVMRAFDIKVTFHLEPYDHRALRLADDVKYLLREYGERRRWDTFLLLEWADGRAPAPVLKLFASILPPTSTDCLGVTRAVPGYVPDPVWRAQTSRLRREVAVDFERFTILADSLDVGRTLAGGFDGGTSADPYLNPERWEEIAGWFAAAGLPFTFAVNGGFDGVHPRTIPDDPCYVPSRLDPAVEVDWSSEESRAAAHEASAARIARSLEESLRLQADLRSANHARGFLLAYVNSFNEWHEGTQFEPTVPFADLTAAQRARYHNAEVGTYRLEALRALMDVVRGQA